MIEAVYENFKCEDCGSEKFTIKNNFLGGVRDITLYCANKDCEASYTFSPEMKLKTSCHPSIRCFCDLGLLSKEDKYCSCCGKKNPNYIKEIKNATRN